MNRAAEIFNQLHGSDQLSLILLAAREACNPQSRNQLLQIVDKEIVELYSIHSLESIRRVLRNFKGTALEPFVVTEIGMELASRFIQVAFSAGNRALGVQIVSEDALTSGGGLSLKPQLQATHAPRFMEANPALDTISPWYINTAAELRQSQYQLLTEGPKLSAICAPDDELGYVVDLHCDDLDSLGWLDRKRRDYLRSLELSLSTSSHLGSYKRSLRALGLEVDVSGEKPARVRISARTAEAMVRFTAALAAEQTMILDPGRLGTSSYARVIIRLEIADDGEACDLGFDVRRKGPMLNEFMNAPTAHLNLNQTEINLVTNTLESTFDTIERRVKQ